MLIKILKKFDKIFLISLILAIVSCFLVPLDKKYLEYFDTQTLITLFLMMLVIAGFRNIRLFEIISDKLVRRFKNTKSIIIFLVIATVIGDMILANDMSLITFIPLTIAIFKGTKQENYIPFTIVMQVIAADLGGMITPFGNPQNLYAYSKYNLHPLEFLRIMIVPFSIAVLLLVLVLLIVPKEKVEIEETLSEYGEKETLNKGRVVIYSLLFLTVILMILRLLPLWLETLIIIPTMLLFDKKAFLKVDYTLLLTFCTLFVLSGNVARLDIVSNFITDIFVGHELELGIGICQFLSNVPTTILLSNFTNNYSALLIAVNIGSLGTLIASMASLIAYRQFVHEFRKEAGVYLKIFTLINILFLVVMYIFVKLMRLA